MVDAAAESVFVYRLIDVDIKSLLCNGVIITKLVNIAASAPLYCPLRCWLALSLADHVVCYMVHRQSVRTEKEADRKAGRQRDGQTEMTGSNLANSLISRCYRCVNIVTIAAATNNILL